MPIYRLFGSGVEAKNQQVTAQRRVNMVAEPTVDGDKTKVVYVNRPGITHLVASSAGGLGSGPALGLATFGYQNGPTDPTKDYVWMPRQGGWTYWDTPTTNLGSNGAVGEGYPGVTRMSMAYNGQRWFAVDGLNCWWGVPTGAIVGGLILGTATFPWFGATSVCFLASRWICNYPAASGRFCWSPLNSGIAQAWNGLDYATAESAPDPLVAVWAVRGELLLFGTQTLEFWRPDPARVFSNIQGSTQPWGIAAQWSLQTLGNDVYFLGVGTNGKPQVCKLSGYQVTPISTPDIETIIEQDPSPAGVTGVAFSFLGHSYYVLNLTNTSYAFDTTTGVWSEWQTDGGRWAGQFVTLAWGKVLVSDYRDGRLHEIDETSFTDDGALMLREVDTRHLFKDLERLTVWELVLDVETGVGLNSGQGSNPQIMLQVSRDGGHTFGNELWTGLGALGDYLQRVVWRRLGRARDFVFRFRVTDPVKVVLIQSSIRAD